MMIQSLCVYCGSSMGADPAYKDSAEAVGRLLGSAGIELVYGGGRVGLMGTVADAALRAGGRVTGIIPRFLHDYEIGHHGLSELVVVDTMHERKRLMAERSQAFVILPGGFGTLDEAFEMLTWRQLRLHDKPIIFANVNGYWQPYLDLVDRVIGEGFARASNRDLFTLVDSVDALLPTLRSLLPAGPEDAIRIELS